MSSADHDIHHVGIEMHGNTGRAIVSIRSVSGATITLSGPFEQTEQVFYALTEYLEAARDDFDESDDFDPIDTDDEDDGDALASAGFGTDEDYGGPVQ